MRAVGRVSVAAAVAIAAAAGWWVGRGGLPLERPSITAATKSGGSGAVIYYRDPDGRPVYSAAPRNTDDGRAFAAVRASEDVGFDGAPARAQGQKTVLYYRNPMGLPDVSPVPKKDPMGMDYIAVHEGDDEGDGSALRISPGRLQRLGVRSEPVQRQALVVPVRIPGVIEPDERRIAVVTVRSQSFIEKVEAVTSGEHVHQGQPLMRLYSPEIAAAAAQYLSVVNQPSASGAQALEGARRRLENLGTPAEVLAEIDRTHKVPMSITWRAPRDGVVIERNVSDGTRAMPGAVLFRIEDHAVVWVLADVAERDFGLLAQGQRAVARVRGFPERAFAGTIALIYPHLAMQTRTARVRIELPNPDGLLRPAMYADVDIDTGTNVPVLTVAESAVIDSGTRQLVIIDKGEGRFEPRDVKLGRRGSGLVEIREGVEEGDRVVVAANFLIDAESNLRAALRGLTQGGEPR